MPDGEFLCPKCKADEAALPPTPSNRSRSNSATVSMPQARANGQLGKNGGQSMSAAGVAGASGAGAGAAMGLCNGGLSRAEGQQGVGEEDAGVIIVATDGSPVEVTQIARLEHDFFLCVCVYVHVME